MKRITLDPSLSHPLSYASTSMRLFQYEGMLLRGIDAARAPGTRQLLETGVLQKMIERGLFVQTEISDYSSDEYPLILQHEKIPTITYPNEWAPEALKAAGMAVLDLLD